MGIRVGIDLGTTFSAVARIDPILGKPVIIKNNFGASITPSVICFESNGSVLFGEDAKSLLSMGNTNAISLFKRSMGKEFFSVEVFGKTYSAIDLSAILLKKLADEAEQQSGEKIEAAVITVPAYFTHKEREATMQAGKKAGLEIISIINEPTAAALAYGLTDRINEQTVLIYDLGGGTFDVTLAKISNNEIFELGSDGNHELGGKDWDDCIARYISDEFFERYGIDFSDDLEMAAAMLVTAENVKKQLTSVDCVSVPINYRGVRGSVDITIETFEAISQFLINETKDVINRLFDSLKVSWSQIDGVILVGGSTRMRMVHKYIYEISGQEPLCGINVDEAVALGAAIRANIHDNGELFRRSDSLPGRTKSEISFIRGAKSVSYAIAHSLGMISISPNGEEYINSIIIKKNTRIPVCNTKPFSFRTRAKNNELEIYVLQGEHKRPLDNTIVNKYVIYNIEKTVPPTSIIEVSYQYDSNGIIEIFASQNETCKKLPIRIESVPEDMSWTDLSPKENLSENVVLSADVILAIDLSGSMDGVPTREAIKAMTKFVNDMDNSFVKIGICVFADRTEMILNPTQNFDLVHKTIISLESVNVGGGTSAEPFTIAHNVLKSGLSMHASDMQYIVVLTDGCWGNADAGLSSAAKCHQDGIEVIALGFGSADYSFLQKIASTDDFAVFTDMSNLGSSFSKIAQAIGESSTGLITKL